MEGEAAYTCLGVTLGHSFGVGHIQVTVNDQIRLHT